MKTFRPFAICMGCYVVVFAAVFAFLLSLWNNIPYVVIEWALKLFGALFLGLVAFGPSSVRRAGAWPRAVLVAVGISRVESACTVPGPRRPPPNRLAGGALSGRRAWVVEVWQKHQFQGREG